MVHPAPNRLVRRRHSAFRQQILDVAQAEREPEVKPYRSLNDLRRETIPAVADLVHLRGTTRPSRTPQARSAVTMPLRDTMPGRRARSASIARKTSIGSRRLIR